MPKPSAGAYNPGTHGGHSLAEAIEGVTPTGVSGDDSRTPPPVKCRWKDCHTTLAVTNRPGRVKRQAQPEAVEASDETPTDDPDESGVHQTLPPVAEAVPDAPAKKNRKSQKSKYKKNAKPKWQKHGLCFIHQTLLNDIEIGLVTDVTPAFKDDPPPAPPEPETPTDTDPA